MEPFQISATVLSIFVGLVALAFAFYAYTKANDLNRQTESALQDINAKANEIRDLTVRVVDRAIDSWTTGATGSPPISKQETSHREADPTSSPTTNEPSIGTGNGTDEKDHAAEEALDRKRHRRITEQHELLELRRALGEVRRTTTPNPATARHDSGGRRPHQSDFSVAQIDEAFLAMWKGGLDRYDRAVLAYLASNAPASLAQLDSAEELSNGGRTYEQEIRVLSEKRLLESTEGPFGEISYRLIPNAKTAFERLLSTRLISMEDTKPADDFPTIDPDVLTF